MPLKRIPAKEEYTESESLFGCVFLSRVALSKPKPVLWGVPNLEIHPFAWSPRPKAQLIVRMQPAIGLLVHRERLSVTLGSLRAQRARITPRPPFYRYLLQAASWWSGFRTEFQKRASVLDGLPLHT